jgi:hypothetical protein
LQGPGGGQPSPFKLTIGESIDRIKEEFSFLQAQYNRYENERSDNRDWFSIIIVFGRRRRR